MCTRLEKNASILTLKYKSSILNSYLSWVVWKEARDKFVHRFPSLLQPLWGERNHVMMVRGKVFESFSLFHGAECYHFNHQPHVMGFFHFNSIIKGHNAFTSFHPFYQPSLHKWAWHLLWIVESNQPHSTPLHSYPTTITISYTLIILLFFVSINTHTCDCKFVTTWAESLYFHIAFKSLFSNSIFFFPCLLFLSNRWAIILYEL